MKTRSLLLIALAALASQAEPMRHGRAENGLERVLYVTDKTGISVYDINDGHKLLRKIEVPDSGGYKGISASPQLGKLYVTSYLKDELICIDLLTDQIVWRKKYGK